MIALALLYVVTDKSHRKKCTVFPFHPEESVHLENRRRHGIVIWVPRDIQELICVATDKLNLPTDSCILLSADAGIITDVDMISDGQKLYLISETNY